MPSDGKIKAGKKKVNTAEITNITELLESFRHGAKGTCVEEDKRARKGGEKKNHTTSRVKMHY